MLKKHTVLKGWVKNKLNVGSDILFSFSLCDRISWHSAALSTTTAVYLCTKTEDGEKLAWLCLKWIELKQQSTSGNKPASVVCLNGWLCNAAFSPRKISPSPVCWAHFGSMLHSHYGRQSIRLQVIFNGSRQTEPAIDFRQVQRDSKLAPTFEVVWWYTDDILTHQAVLWICFFLSF